MTRGDITADSTGVRAKGAADTVATVMGGLLGGGAPATDAAMIAGGGGSTAGS